MQDAGGLLCDWVSLARRAFPAECRRRGGDKWAAVQEGRHAGLTGKWFLQAVGTRRGRLSAAAAAERFREVLADIDRRPGRDLSIETLRAMLDAGQGILLRMPRNGQSGRVSGRYNRMDGARQVWMWAAYTGRICAAPLPDEVFRKVLLLQSPVARKALAALGVTDADTLEAKRSALHNIARRHDPSGVIARRRDPGEASARRHGPGDASAPRHDPGDASARRHDPGDVSARRHDPGDGMARRHDPGRDPSPGRLELVWKLSLHVPTWPTVLAHACEYGQLRARYGLRLLRRASGMPRRIVAAHAAAVLGSREPQDDPSNGGACTAVRIFRHVRRALPAAKPEAKPAFAAVAGKPSQVICGRCGACVLRSNIAKHRKTDRCTWAPLSQPKDARRCDICGAEVHRWRMSRHQLSKKCQEAAARAVA